MKGGIRVKGREGGKGKGGGARLGVVAPPSWLGRREQEVKSICIERETKDNELNR